MADSRATLSVCMIVKNEAHNIEDALRCVRVFADEIVVVDTGSTDATPHLARSFTPLVFYYPWHDDFSAARNFSLEKASSSYCLWWDADDRIDPENTAKVNGLKKYFDGFHAFSFELRDIRDGKVYCSLYQVRCFPNRSEIRFRGRIHETINWDELTGDMRLVNTDIVLTHHGYSDPTLLGKKLTRTILLLQKEKESGRDDETLHYYLGLSYSQLGQNDRAIVHFSEVANRLDKKKFRCEETTWLRLNPFWLDVHLLLAHEWLSVGRPDEARRWLSRVCCQEGLHPGTFYRIGMLHQKLGDHARALQAFARVRLDKQMPLPVPVPRVQEQDLAARMALSLFALGRTEEARAHLECFTDSAIRRDVWERLGIEAADGGLIDLAEIAFRETLRYGSLSADGWDRWGAICQLRGDVRRAEIFWNKALSRTPGMESALVRLGNLYLQTHRKVEAYEVFKKLVNEGCLKIPVLLTLGWMAMDRDDLDAMKSVLSGVLLTLSLPAEDQRENASSSPLLVLAESLETQGKQHLAHLARRMDLWVRRHLK